MNVQFSWWTQVHGESPPVSTLGQVKSIGLNFSLNSHVFTYESEKLGKGKLYAVEINIIVPSCFSIGKFCHFD